MSKTFCPIPWNFQAVRNNGDIRVCCQANVTENQGVVRHKDGTPYNAGKHSMAQARNAPLMKIMRKNMLNGVWSDECTRCRQEEEVGLNSRRQYENQQWKYDIKDAQRVTKEDGSIDTEEAPAVYYDLRFGNLCNLQCRMCGPTDSHTWYEQWTEYHKEEGFKDTHGYVKLNRNSKGRLETNDYNWHGSKSFWTNIEKNLDNIRHVYMAGGEPMMIERHYEFLEKCIKKDVAQNILLEYNTNMTTLPDRVMEMWKSFKEVRIGASIDGYGDVLNYQRFPIKWEQAKKNLDKLDLFAQENKNIMCWIAFTVTVNNVFHLPEFIKWKVSSSGWKKINSTLRRPIITHHVAHGPKRMNIKILPPKIKEDLEKYYESWKNVYRGEFDELRQEKACKILDSVLQFAKSEDYSDSLQSFVNFTKYLDKTRKQDIRKVVPRLKELFND
tara:strand:- start:389 stop:1711 length:1323 start_codon:yes stop_codon:yes gene_type:complete